MKELFSIFSACLMFLNLGFGKSRPEYSAWIPWWDETKALQSIESVSQILDEAMPVWYKIDENGQLAQIQTEKQQEILRSLKDKGIKITPSVVNEFDPQRVTILLESPELQENFISSAMNAAKENEYSGWDIDFEQIIVDDKDRFSEFVKKFARQLHENNFTLSTSVHAKTGGSSDSVASQAMDYDALGQAADFVRVMAYDYHHTGSDAGPVTPIDWLEAVIDYSVSKIDRKKVVIALPLYGYEWSDQGATAILYDNVVANPIFSALQRDSESHVLNATLDSKTVWIEDQESVLQKIETAKNKGIYKFSFWKLGGEDLRLWERLSN